MARWELAAKARNDFADTLATLTPEQLQAQTLCSSWTPHEVAAHLTSFVETGGFGLFGLMVSSGFNFEKVSAKMVAKRSGRTIDDLLAALRADATKSAPLPMFPEAMTVSDVTIHTQDVRRPLGLGADIDEAVQRTVLDFLTTHKMATTLVDRRPIDDVSLRATDLDWSLGEGPEITGTAEALMMGLANRDVLDELSGDGLAKWT